MLMRLRLLLAPPVFADEEQTRVAALLNTMTLSSLVLFALRGLISLVFHPHPLPLMAVAGLMMVLAVVVWLLTRRGHVRLACLLFPGALWVITTLVLVYFGVRLPIFHAYLFLIVIAGLLLEARGALGFAGVSITASFGPYWRNSRGS